MAVTILLHYLRIPNLYVHLPSVHFAFSQAPFALPQLQAALDQCFLQALDLVANRLLLLIRNPACATLDDVAVIQALNGLYAPALLDIPENWIGVLELRICVMHR